MLTFQQLYEEVQEQVQDDSADSLVLIKRALNQGHRKFASVLHRDWRVSYKTFSLVASQQYYQTPEDAVRVKSLTVTRSSIIYPLTEIADEYKWQVLNARTQTSDNPSYFYVRGSDEFGIWPVPATNGTNAGTLAYERKVRDMSQADYTTGTVAITSGSATVEGTGVTFTATMVGRYLRVDDPSGDGMYYKITGFTDADTITLENTYGGSTVSTATYSIGEAPDIPEEFHESLIDYACFRYYLRRRDEGNAKDFKALYEMALEECRENYSSKIQSQYMRARTHTDPDNPWTREPDVAT